MISLYNQDCIEGIYKHLQQKTVSVIVTSPPYNIKKEYSTYKDNLSSDDFFDFMRKFKDACYWALEDNGSLFLNFGSKPSTPHIPYDICNIFRETFILQNTIYWVKNITIDSVERSFGHFKPINSPRYVNDCVEFIWHFTKKGDTPLDRKAVGVKYQDDANVKRWASAKDGLRCRGNAWFIPYQTVQKRSSGDHPATFPVDIPRRCMMLHGVNNIKLALDPFVGEGSSAIAAKELKVNFVGFDIDSKYLEKCKSVLGE